MRGESLVYWLKKLVFRSAWLDHRVKEGLLEVDWDDERQDFTFADTNGGRALLELLPTPSWHELQYRPMSRLGEQCHAGTRSSCRRTSRRCSRSTRRSSLRGQLALGALTFVVLAVALRPLAPLVRAQAVGVVALRDRRRGDGLARLGRLPLPPPQPAALHPAGARARLPERGRAEPERCRSARASSGPRRSAPPAWGIAGLTVLPRLDVAGAVGVPLLLVFLWRSRWRATYAGVFLVVAALELYGTSIGTWRWATTLPGLGIPDGNPPSGVASGYVWFDVMALLVAPWLVYVAREC